MNKRDLLSAKEALNEKMPTSETSDNPKTEPFPSK